MRMTSNLTIKYYLLGILQHVFKLVVGISESSNSRVSNQNSRSRLESLGESLDSRNFQSLVLEI
jgi:hypothetical protein